MKRTDKFILAVAGAVAAVLAVGLGVYSLRQIMSPPDPVGALEPAPTQKPLAAAFAPSLYCAFDDITRSSIIVAFDFAVAFQKDGSPRFGERYIGSVGATQTFAADHSPTWPFAHDEDGTPTITSPDGATRIMLYGLKLATPGVLLIEAGLRSNTFRNLDGQCRQANFGASGR